MENREGRLREARETLGHRPEPAGLRDVVGLRARLEFVALTEELAADSVERRVDRHEHQRIGGRVDRGGERHVRQHVRHEQPLETAGACGRGAGHEAGAHGIRRDRTTRQAALQFVGEPQDRQLGVLVGLSGW